MKFTEFRPKKNLTALLEDPKQGQINFRLSVQNRKIINYVFPNNCTLIISVEFTITTKDETC